MTNKIALFLGALVLCGLVIDLLLYDMAGTLFLARKFIELIEWVKFWR